MPLKRICDDVTLLDPSAAVADYSEVLTGLDLVDVSREVAKAAHEDVRDAVALLQALERRLRSIGRH
jgi:hypothetical protein